MGTLWSWTGWTWSATRGRNNSHTITPPPATWTIDASHDGVSFHVVYAKFCFQLLNVPVGTLHSNLCKSLRWLWEKIPVDQQFGKYSDHCLSQTATSQSKSLNLQKWRRKVIYLEYVHPFSSAHPIQGLKFSTLYRPTVYHRTVCVCKCSTSILAIALFHYGPYECRCFNVVFCACALSFIRYPFNLLTKEAWWICISWGIVSEFSIPLTATFYSCHSDLPVVMNKYAAAIVSLIPKQ